MVLGVLCILIGLVVVYFSTPRQLAPVNSQTAVPEGWQAYSVKGLYFNHPASYAVATKEQNPGQSVITVQASGQDRRLAIFKLSDFKGGGPTWVFPDFNDRAGEYLPSDAAEELTKGEFGVWLFYAAGDEAAKAELHAIFDTIKTN